MGKMPVRLETPYGVAARALTAGRDCPAGDLVT